MIKCYKNQRGDGKEGGEGARKGMWGREGPGRERKMSA